MTRWSPHSSLDKGVTLHAFLVLASLSQLLGTSVTGINLHSTVFRGVCVQVSMFFVLFLNGFTFKTCFFRRFNGQTTRLLRIFAERGPSSKFAFFDRTQLEDQVPIKLLACLRVLNGVFQFHRRFGYCLRKAFAWGPHRD